MSRSIAVLALVPSAEAAEDLKSAAAGLAGLAGTAGTAGIRLDLRVTGSQPFAAAVEALSGAGGDVLIVEVGGDAPEERRILARLVREQAAGRPVIALVRQATIADVRELMHLGLTDVVPRPVIAAELSQALAHARRKVQALPRHRGHLVPFLRSCGGAGATTLAVQTALELIRHDKHHPARVCLIDFDVQYGNAALSLDMAESVGLMQILEAPERLDAAFFASALSHHHTGLDVLAAPGEIVPFGMLTVPVAEKILELARDQYDYVLVDLPHAWTAWTPAVLAAASLTVLVVRPDVVGIQRARHHLKLITDERLDTVPRLVVANRVAKGWGAGWRRRLSEAEAALGHAIAASVRRDDPAADTARDRGVPLNEAASGSAIGKDVRALVRQILMQLPVELVKSGGVKSEEAESTAPLFATATLKAAR